MRSPAGGARATTLAPFAQPIFRMLWIAGLVSNVGTWMQEVGEAWLMTSLSSSPLVVAVLQSADSFAILLFSLPAGALADLFDRRRVAIGAQLWLLSVAGLLSLMTYTHTIAVSPLIALTFLMGMGAAVNSPVWQSLTPEVVSREDLPAAITLSGVSMNVARALGPAAGGAVVAAAGPFAVFLLNAATYAFVAAALLAWRRQPAAALTAPPERWLGAMLAGLRYVRHTPALRAAFARGAATLFFGSALMGLLPLHARRTLGVQPTGYGILIGCLGLGAVAATPLLGQARRHLAPDGLLAIGSVAFAVATGGLAVAHGLASACLPMFVAGVGWMTMLSSLNIAVQQASSTWVRGRVLSAYLVVFQAGIGIGALTWGSIATKVGIPTTYFMAAGGLLGSLLLRARFPLPRIAPDLTPSGHWGEPILITELEGDEGPVLVMVEYRVATGRQAEFATSMARLSAIRRRDGAFEWELYRDPADEARMVETFVVADWSEHLRQHERATVADKEEEDRVLGHLIPGSQVVVTHLVAARGGKRSAEQS